MADVFISYPRSQRALVEPIKQRLEALGLSVFFDVHGIDGGAEFPDVIDRELRACKAVLSCWSQAYFERRWCMIEARIGLDKNILVPIAIQRFEKDAPPADLRFVNFYNLSDWSGDDAHDEWTRTLGMLSRYVGRTLTPTAKQSAPPPKAAPAGRNKSGTIWRERIPGLAENASPEMVTLPSGRFVMGGAANEPKQDGYDGREEPLHEVSIGYVFAMGRYAVTVAEFAVFADQTRYDAGDNATIWSTADSKWIAKNGVNWRTPGFEQKPNHPAVCLSSLDALAYIDWLNRKLGLAGKRDAYRLPSEAEWEYACRAGTRTPYAYGQTILDAHANFNNRNGRTRPCGSYAANAWGLHDMHGNACEWCEDVWHPNYAGAPTDGSAWKTGGDPTRRVLRGGAWALAPALVRSATRIREIPDGRTNCIGFRLARTLA